MSLQGKVFKLNNGKTIPAVGFGTGTKWYKFGNDEVDTKLVSTLERAIKVGFDHIDGAEVYGTEVEIGKAVKESGIKRDDIFLTTKYFAGDGSYTTHSKEANPYESLKASLKKLQVDYVDLYLLHAPFIKKESHGFTLVEAWNYLEKLVEDGYAKSIGVSNFAVDDLKEILASNPKIKPAINQIEFNAYLQNQTPGIVEFTQEHGILVEAYSPLGPIVKGSPGPLDDTLKNLSKKYSKSEGQILLRWVLQRNILPITTSGNEERRKQFIDIFDFKLTTEEENEITKIGSKKVLRQYWTKEYSKFD
ncbi:uncharacterized protein PRCAT00003738001 [Priceomyces carsonii]|uniref:uncharacterized protein n=1 Tax=Priceomyces carsonii TaxID=28549 RepID=UPI002ED96784|nr:unnamed protein product [Priceomyces carsonii]